MPRGFQDLFQVPRGDVSRCQGAMLLKVFYHQVCVFRENLEFRILKPY